MPSLRVKVNQQRWDAPTQRWQNPGEEVVIQDEDPELFRQACLPYAFTSTPVNGDWPFLEPKSPGWFDKVKSKGAQVAKSIAGRATGKSFSNLNELTDESVEVKKDSKGWVCPDCERHYKSEKGLLKHFKRSGHGAPKTD